eukprot:scaffold11316_cov112-Isochrysis_galbana.AAC.5
MRHTVSSHTYTSRQQGGWRLVGPATPPHDAFLLPQFGDAPRRGAETQERKNERRENEDGWKQSSTTRLARPDARRTLASHMKPHSTQHTAHTQLSAVQRRAHGRQKNRRGSPVMSR